MIENLEEKQTRNIKRFRVECQLLSPAHLGGLNDPLSSADNPIALVGGRLCIPGPSFKGALRNELERWLVGVFYGDGKWQDDNLKPCVPATKPSRDEEALAKEGKYRDRSCSYRDDGRGTICPVCYVLGAMGLVGFVSVPFLFSEAPRGELYSSRLDRVSRTVVHGSNRPYQLAPQESKFVGEIEVLLKDDLLGWEFGKMRPVGNAQADAWLQKLDDIEQNKLVRALVTERVERISGLGGYRSKGFGRVKMSVSEIG